jgi:hypothetical protein
MLPTAINDPDGPRPLLITGLPGSGKSEFAEALHDLGWTFLEGDRADRWPDDVHDAWDRALDGDDAGLLDVARRNPGGLVIEWGFPADRLPTIKSLISRGYECWYFDGDRAAAFEAWRNAKPTRPEGWFHEQVDGLAAIQHRIEEVFGARRTMTIEAGPIHVSTDNLVELISPRWPRGIGPSESTS